jgi:hypothetical protein
MWQELKNSSILCSSLLDAKLNLSHSSPLVKLQPYHQLPGLRSALNLIQPLFVVRKERKESSQTTL